MPRYAYSMVVAMAFVLFGGASALADQISDETFLELGRCEGFYKGLIAEAASEETAEPAKKALERVVEVRDRNPRPDLEEAYKEAVATGKSAIRAAAGLGSERFNAYIKRRSSHCDAVVSSLTVL